MRSWVVIGHFDTKASPISERYTDSIKLRSNNWQSTLIEVGGEKFLPRSWPFWVLAALASEQLIVPGNSVVEGGRGRRSIRSEESLVVLRLLQRSRSVRRAHIWMQLWKGVWGCLGVRGSDGKWSVGWLEVWGRSMSWYRNLRSLWVKKHDNCKNRLQ